MFFYLKKQKSDLKKNIYMFPSLKYALIALIYIHDLNNTTDKLENELVAELVDWEIF